MQKLWADKYRPTQIHQLNLHSRVNDLLLQLSRKDDFPHLVLYGPDGVGKKTRAMCFLEKVFGSGVYKVKCVTKIFKPEGTSTDIEYNMLESNHHLDLTPAMSERNDRHVIKNAIKESAEMANVEKSSKKFKVIVINEADKLTKEAQASLRRTMEKYTKTVRLLLICESPHKLMAPIRSRCLSIRMGYPEASDVFKVISHVVDQEGCSSSLNRDQLEEIANSAAGNLRKALLSLQLAAVYPEYKKPNLDEWKQQIQKIVKTIILNPSQQVYKIAEDGFYKVMISGVDPEQILRQLVEQLLKNKLSQRTTFDLIHKASETQRNINLGDKAIYHLVAFTAYCVAVIQSEL